MKNGFRVYDTDTHINPAAEVLDKYVDPDFRRGCRNWRHTAIGRRSRGRRAAQLSRRHQILPADTWRGRARAKRSPAGKPKWMGSKRPRPGIQDDQAENRVKDMDDEGTDVHFLIPTSWLSLVGVDDASIEIAMIRAYHRHMAEFCAPYPDRLKGPIVASTRRVDEAVREIREWGKAKWAVAVMPLLAEGLAGGSPEPRADLAGSAGIRSADRQPQLYLDPAVLSRLSRSLRQHLPRPARRTSVGGDAVRRRVHRRRPVRPLSEAADGRARMRLRLAAVLGAAHGRAGDLRGRHCAAEDEAERIHDERTLLLQHRAPRGRGYARARQPIPGGRRADVRVRLSAFRMPVSLNSVSNILAWSSLGADTAAQATVGESQPVLPANVAGGMPGVDA